MIDQDGLGFPQKRTWSDFHVCQLHLNFQAMSFQSHFVSFQAVSCCPQERTDVFSEFLRNVEAERVARLGALNDNWEDQAKRRLGQVHRRTQLALDLMGDEVRRVTKLVVDCSMLWYKTEKRSKYGHQIMERCSFSFTHFPENLGIKQGPQELKEKRYTNTGHHVFMKSMKKANKCWSDPTLVHEAAKEKAGRSRCNTCFVPRSWQEVGCFCCKFLLQSECFIIIIIIIIIINFVEFFCGFYHPRNNNFPVC